jgi:two-component system LytT family response regulator
MHSKIPQLALKSGIYTYFINKNDILYFKAEGAYSKIYMADGSLITISKNLKSLENQLSSEYFFRIHHSYTINLLYVVCYKNNGDNYVVMVNGEQVPLARSRKTAFFQLFQLL